MFTTDARGTYVAGDLPFGRYRLRVEMPGFAAFSSVVDVRSEVPQPYPIVLSVAPVTRTASATERLLKTTLPTKGESVREVVMTHGIQQLREYCGKLKTGVSP